MTAARIELALGPLLFNWPAERTADFYARIADETPVDRVYLGEVVCGKREPLLAKVLIAAAERLERAGKTVVRSTLALPTTPRDRRTVKAVAIDEGLVEINDVSALMYRPAGAPFVAGPLLNIYNEDAAGELAARGCVRLCANVELPLSALKVISQANPGLQIELFAFGRLQLALSGRCYHARAQGLHKDTCVFVCDRDADGLAVSTLDGNPFLAINGVQTLSHGMQLCDASVDELRGAGVSALRLSPHSTDMVRVIAAFRQFADHRITPGELAEVVLDLGLPGPLVSGYLHGHPGVRGLELPVPA